MEDDQESRPSEQKEGLLGDARRVATSQRGKGGQIKFFKKTGSGSLR